MGNGKCVYSGSNNGVSRFHLHKSKALITRVGILRVHPKLDAFELVGADIIYAPPFPLFPLLEHGGNLHNAIFLESDSLVLVRDCLCIMGDEWRVNLV
jgi:hypothetical protein